MTSIYLGIGKCSVASYGDISIYQFEMTQLLRWYIIKQSYNHNCLFKDLCQWGHRTKHDSEKAVVNTPVVRIFISSEDGLSLQITWKCVKKAEEKAASTGKVTVENLNSYLQQWGEMNNKYRLEIAPNLDQKNIRNRILEEG